MYNKMCIFFLLIFKVMKNIAILLMGGVGKRFSIKTPKQFYLIQNIPVFIYCLRTFVKIKSICEIILVINPSHLKKVTAYLKRYKLFSKITLINGSTSRAFSLLNGIKYVVDNYKDDVKIISHDVARAFVSKNIINEHIKVILLPNEVISTVIPCADALLKINVADFSPVNRDDYLIMQTPQSFNARNLYSLIMNNINSYDKYQDLCSFAIANGYKNSNILGNKLNFKITTTQDIALLYLLSKK